MKVSDTMIIRVFLLNTLIRVQEESEYRVFSLVKITTQEKQLINLAQIIKNNKKLEDVSVF